LLKRKKEPVSIKKQTIYALIPFLDLYAAYKVEKFTLYFAIIVPITIGVSYALEMVFPVPDIDRLTLEAFSSLSLFYNSIATYAITTPLAVYLIRRWSKKWNERFGITDCSVD